MNRLLFKTAMTMAVCMCLYSCKEEQAEIPETPHNPDPLPTEDLLSVKVNEPTYVIGGDWDEVGRALYNRLTRKQPEIDNSTRIVLLGADIQMLSDEQIAAIRKVCEAGGAVGLCNPSLTFAQELCAKLGVSFTRIKDHDDHNGHFADMYLFNSHGDKCEIQDIHDDDKQHFVTTDSTENVITSDSVVVFRETLTPYEYGLYANAAAEWLNTYSTGFTHATRSQRMNENNLKALAHAQSERFVYAPTFMHDNDNMASEKAKGRTAPYQITYTIYSFYSFEQQADYYMVHQEIIGNNTPMFIGHWKNNKEDCYGFYLGCINNQSIIYNSSGQALDLQKAEIHETTPTTSIGSSSVTSGYSINFGGEIGLSGNGLSGAVSGGGSFTESYTTELPDIKISNESLSYGCDAKWFYDCGEPQIRSNIWGHGTIQDAPLITRSTISLHNCWYWKVNNIPENSSEYFNMSYSNRIIFDYTHLRNYSLSYKAGYIGGGQTFNGNFRLNAPNRKRQ